MEEKNLPAIMWMQLSVMKVNSFRFDVGGCYASTI